MDGLMVAIMVLDGFMAIVLILCLILVGINLYKVSWLWLIHINVILGLELACISITLFSFGNNLILNFSKSFVFLNFFLKLIVNLAITIRLYSKKQMDLILILDMKNRVILFYNVILLASLVTISYLLFEYVDILTYFGLESILITSFVVISVTVAFCIQISKKNVKLITNIEILLKIILTDCYFYSIVISMVAFEDFKNLLSIFCCFLIFCLYCYTNTKFMLKYDQAEYWNKSKNNIYRNMKLYRCFFMLNEKNSTYKKIFEHEKLFDDENTEHPLNHNCSNESNKGLICNKEFIYLNFCFLNTYFNQKVEINQEISTTLCDRINTKESMGFCISNYEKYFSDANFSIEKLKNLLNENSYKEEVNIIPYFIEKFMEIQSLLNINFEMLVGSLNPLLNIKICHRFEKKIQENKEKKDFSSFDCFLSFELYTFEKLESIKTFLIRYFDYLQLIKFEFSKTFLPLILGCFEIEVFDLKYVILLYRHNHAFSSFHEMKYCSLICFDDLNKEINYSSNQISNSFMNFFESQNFNNVHLKKEEFEECYKIFHNDLKFLSGFLRTKFKISVFLVNDLFIFSSEKRQDSVFKEGELRKNSSQKFDESIIENFSKIEQIDINSTPSTLSQFEEIYIINIRNRNSRLIIKINFFELFNEEIVNEEVKIKYLKDLEENVFTFIQKSTKDSFYDSD